MKPDTLLTNLGIRPVAADVYLELLKQGPQSIRTLSALTGQNRGIVYESLKELIDLGLVSYVQKGQRRTFAAASPDTIGALVDERLRKDQIMQAEAARIIPSLMAHDRHRLGEPAVAFYRDDEGVALILRDVLATVDKLPDRRYRVYSSQLLRGYIYKRFPSFTERRIKQQIFVSTIAVGEGGSPAEFSERRWMPNVHPDNASSYILIYGHKLALISISADNTPYGIIIEEPGVATMQRFLFDQLWATLAGQT